LVGGFMRKERAGKCAENARREDVRRNERERGKY
jgi:hypothetical protein